MSPIASRAVGKLTGIFGEAWRLYRRYRDHVLSLCDCASFAVMRRRRIQTAFAYDDDFDAVGFSRLQ